MSIEIRQIVYRLKRLHGEIVDLYTMTGTGVNHRTGLKTVTRTVTRIKRAVVLPVSVKEDRLGISGSFGYGGVFRTGDCIVLIDANDLSSTYTFGKNSYVVIDGKRYEVVERLTKEAHFLHLRHTADVLPVQILNPHVVDTMAISETANGS